MFLLFLLLEVIALLITFNVNAYHNSVFFQYSSSINNYILSVRSNIISFINLRGENERLLRENILLRSRGKESFIISDQRVFMVDDNLYRQEFDYITAAVINYTINYQNNYITLDKGSEQGVEEGMGVFSPDGVVGIVSNTSKNYCLVKSILHSDISLSAQIKDKGATGTSYWDGMNYAYGVLKDIPVHIKINVGDTIITSNYSNIFPTGINIGYVESFKADETRAFYNIKFRLAADFGKLNSVYIVRNLIKSELDELDKFKEDQKNER
jgi:rod shape-determining protein MreC